MAALARPIGAGGQPTSRHVWPEPLAQRVQDAELPQRRALILRFEAWARTAGESWLNVVGWAPLVSTWRGGGRGSPREVRGHAPTRLHDAVCASDGRLRMCGGCAGPGARELVRLVAGAPAVRKGGAHHGRHDRAPGRA
jgi:hypothetical protein